MNKFFSDKKAIESQGLKVMPSFDGAYIYDPVAKRVVCHKGDQWDLIAAAGKVKERQKNML